MHPSMSKNCNPWLPNMDEIEFYSNRDVVVTNARFIVSSQTYPRKRQTRASSLIFPHSAEREALPRHSGYGAGSQLEDAEFAVVGE